MKRRLVLATTGLSLISGCLSETSDSPQEPEKDSTEPDSAKPAIEELNLISHWSEYGDVEENSITSTGVGSYAPIGIKYSMPVHNGKSEEFIQTTIYHDGTSVDSKSAEDTDLSDTNQSSQSFDRAFPFDTENWESGSYTVEAIVRDEISGTNSARKELSFELIDPLRPNEVELIGVETPPTVTKGHPFSFDLQLKNTSNVDNGVVSTLSVRYENGDWQTYSEGKFRINIPSGHTRIWESAEITLDYEGTYEFKIDDIETTFTISVDS